MGGAGSFDLMAQRYAAAAQPPPAPAASFVSALSQSSLSVTWRGDLAGFPVSYYEPYVDDSAAPILVTNNMWVGTLFNAGTTHSFSLKCKLTDGRVSPRSEVTVGKTWSADTNGDGLPDDWQRLYWGINSKNWGGKEADSDNDGASNGQEFLADTDPTDDTSVLRTFVLLHATWNPAQLERRAGLDSPGAGFNGFAIMGRFWRSSICHRLAGLDSAQSHQPEGLLSSDSHPLNSGFYVPIFETILAGAGPSDPGWASPRFLAFGPFGCEISDRRASV